MKTFITGAALGAVCAAGLGAVALAPSASAEIIDRSIEVTACPPDPQSGNQICNTTPSVRVRTDGPIFVSFTASPKHCSDIKSIIIVDGKTWGATEVQRPGQTDGGYFISSTPGEHTIAVAAVGLRGGCNTAGLKSWAGTLRVETNADALNGRG